MTQWLAFRQRERGINAAQDLRLAERKVFRAERDLFLHAEGTAGKLQPGRLLDKLDGLRVFRQGALPYGRA